MTQTENSFLLLYTGRADRLRAKMVALLPHRCVELAALPALSSESFNNWALTAMDVWASVEADHCRAWGTLALRQATLSATAQEEEMLRPLKDFLRLAATLFDNLLAVAGERIYPLDVPSQEELDAVLGS
jgi:hypothetical protein